MDRRLKLKEMNTTAHKMAQSLVDDVEDLIKQTEQNAQLGRKLRSDSEEKEHLDHMELLYTLEAANRHLKFARELLSSIDEEVKKERMK